jgi:hypothetical protein
MNLNEIKKRILNLEKELDVLKKEVHAIEAGGETVETPGAVAAEKSITPQKPKKKKNIEYNIGGYVIGVIGALAVVFAVGWLIKLSIDRRWLNESARIMNSLIIGFGVISGAMYLYKKRFHILPNVILGLAYGILYLAVFSAYYFYSLLGIQETFVFLTIITLASVIFSRVAQSQILYIFSLIGAFAAPLLLSSGENSYHFLFTYLTVLNLIFLFMSRDFPWKVTSYIILIANFVIYWGWMDANLKDSSLTFPVIYLFILIIIFFMRIYFMLQKNHKINKFDYILLIAGFMVFVISGHASFNYHNKALVPFFYLSAAFLVIGFSMSYKKIEKDYNDIKKLLLILIIPVLLTGLEIFAAGPWWIVAVISISGMISATALFSDNRAQTIASVILWFSSFLYIVGFLGDTGTASTALWNSRFFVYCLTALFLILTYAGNRENPPVKAFAIIGYLFLVAGMLHENHDIFIYKKEIRRLMYTNIILLSGIIPIVFGIIRHKLTFRLTGIALLAVAVLKFYFYDVWTLDIVFRIIAGFTLGTALILMAVFYQKFKEKVIKPMLSKSIAFLLVIILFPAVLFADSVRTKSFRYYRILKTETLSKDDIYGIIRLDDAIYKHSFGTDLRVIHKDMQLPYFKRAEFTRESLKYKPVKVIFRRVDRWGRTYIVKLPKIPENSMYTSVSINVPKKIKSRFEVNLQVSKSENLKGWISLGTRSLFRYSGYSQLTFHVNLKKSRFLRIKTNRRFPIIFNKAAYLPREKKEYSRDLKVENINISQNSDKKATAIYIENESRIKLNRIALQFKEKRFSRSFKIYTKKNRKYSYFMSGNLWQTEKTLHYIDLSSLTQSPMKILIFNNDNKPLTVEKISVYGPREILIFSLPQTRIDKDIRLYYGNKYAKTPGYDIRSTFGKKLKKKYISLGNHTKNPNFSYSPFEPPVSKWIIRILFFLGFGALLFPTYKIIRVYVTEMNKLKDEKDEEKA